MALHIFTFASDINRLAYLKQTENNNNNCVKYLIKDKWNGYIDKLSTMKETLESIPLNDIVCFIDGYDVLINSDNETIIDRFKSYNCDLLIGAELKCYPECYKPQLDTINKNDVNMYKYINSGGYIGYNKNVKEMLYWKNDDEMSNICRSGSDQAYVIEYYISNSMKAKINIDIYCKIFQNMHWVSWDCLIFNNGVIYNTIMDINPCFIHFNGGTWQTNNRANIMPIFCEKINKSRTNNSILNLNEYQQIVTKTCYPHSQK